MTWTDDPARDADRYFSEQEARLEKLPECEYCGHKIQDEDLFDIEGTLYHVSCAEELFKKDVNNYVR